VLTTNDLWLGGLALARGAQLVRVDVERVNGRPVAVFGLAGDAAEQARIDYHGGTTTVDVQLLKLQVRRLKEKAFDAVRTAEALRKEEKIHALTPPGRLAAPLAAEPRRRAGR
jgi:hypothetical protein